MQFLFGNKVKVIGGFYTGIEGCVVDYSSVDNKYYFEGYQEHVWGAREIKTWINEYDLEKAEE
jgi:hypothetical protein